MSHINLSGAFNPNAAHNHLYTYDINHKITGCNDSQAITLGLSNSQQVIGMHVNDLLPTTVSSVLINNNKGVLGADAPQLLEESLEINESQKVIYSTYKYPLKNERNQFIGVAGMSIPIEIISYNQLENNGLPMELEALTPMQLKFLYFIFKGWSSLKIANKMNLSHQLIEVHFRHILLKLNYRDLSEMITRCDRFSIEELAACVQPYDTIEDLNNHFLIPHALDKQLVKLTKQHSRCFRLLVQGYSAKEIAQRMNLSYRTIQHYTMSINEQLGLTTSRELIRHYAYLQQNL